MYSVAARACGSVLLLAAAIATANAQVAVRVTAAPDKSSAETPLSVVVPADRLTGSKPKNTPAGAINLTCQAEPAGSGKVRLTWISPDLPPGTARVYVLRPLANAAGNKTIELRRSGENVDVFIAGKLFTRYDTTTGPNKPYFYPVNAPTGAQIVRHWPVENVATETHDHPHHRGLWFTHGAVNGVDFWTEGAKTGKTVHTGYGMVESGPLYGLLQTRTDWIMPDGKKIAEDTRDIRVYPIGGGYLMNFSVTVKAVGGPLVWGDTKEGTFALRVADALIADKRKDAPPDTLVGHIENDRGKKDGDTWGKPAAWCDYWGTLNGETVGVAIFDAPQNLRYPTTWHVRTYGLFAANPFGLHDFDSARKADTHAGDFTLPEGATKTWQYRLFFHKGNTHDAHIAEVGEAYANPPKVEVL